MILCALPGKSGKSFMARYVSFASREDRLRLASLFPSYGDPVAANDTSVFSISTTGWSKLNWDELKRSDGIQFYVGYHNGVYKSVSSVMDQLIDNAGFVFEVTKQSVKFIEDGRNEVVIIFRRLVNNRTYAYHPFVPLRVFDSMAKIAVDGRPYIKLGESSAPFPTWVDSTDPKKNPLSVVRSDIMSLPLGCDSMWIDSITPFVLGSTGIALSGGTSSELLRTLMSANKGTAIGLHAPVSEKKDPLFNVDEEAYTAGRLVITGSTLDQTGHVFEPRQTRLSNTARYNDNSDRDQLFKIYDPVTDTVFGNKFKVKASDYHGAKTADDVLKCLMEYDKPEVDDSVESLMIRRQSNADRLRSLI